MNQSVHTMPTSKAPHTFRPRYQRLACDLKGVFLCLAGAAMVWCADAAATVVREPLGEGIVAAIHNGRALYLECRPPKGPDREAFFRKYLSDPKRASRYAAVTAAAIPLDQLNEETRRSMLLVLFKGDVVDAQGWTHEVLFSDTEDMETLWLLCVWITGDGSNYKKIMTANRLKTQNLKAGQTILFPVELLSPVMRKPTPPRLRESPSDLDTAAGELAYGTDVRGAYAEYRLKQGEALFTAVAVRFTNYRETADILKACEEIRLRSGIDDVHNMATGQKVKIPMDMLADRFRPTNSPERRQYEEVVQEARRLRGQVKTRDLDGVVVVIDPGHGGRDHGARNARFSVYEDEINYDIACRVKQLLESTTRARVYMTLRDPRQGYTPTARSRFSHDTDEELLTTPPYRNTESGETDAKVSVNLRWYLANSIYAKETKQGADPRKMIFTSFHCDALFDSHSRGAMVYIPGAQYRIGKETHRGLPYTRYAEFRTQPTVTKSAADCRRDEALSRNFALALLDQLGGKQIKCHHEGDPIRSQIRQSDGRVYVPGVLRNTLIPVKTLIEVANLTNNVDARNVADPAWRQRFAEAYVNALKAYFGA